LGSLFSLLILILLLVTGDCVVPIGFKVRDCDWDSLSIRWTSWPIYISRHWLVILTLSSSCDSNDVAVDRKTRGFQTGKP
jgi:hypothetical protein